MPAARIVTACAFVAVCFITAAPARAQDNPPASTTRATTKPTQDQLLAAFLKYGRPGPEHKLLKQLVGKFDAEMTMLVDGAPAVTSKGTSDSRMILKGRYLQADFNGTMSGRPFGGMSVWAFDRAKKKYLHLWMDDVSTAVLVSEGEADAAGKVITLTATERDPLTNQDKRIKGVLTIVDNDHHTWEAFETIDGQERKMLSIAYTRAK